MQIKDKSLLRVGLITDENEVPFWVNEIIKKVALNPSIQLTKIVGRGTQIHKMSLPFHLFYLMDNTLLPGKPSASVKLKPEFPSTAPVLHLNLKDDNTFDENEINKIRQSNLDVILNLTNTVFNEPVHFIARLGIWSLLFANNNLPYWYAGFWEWFSKSPVSSVFIVRMGESHDSTKIISAANTRTDLLSHSRNQTLIFSTGIELVINALSRLSAGKNPLEQKKEIQISSQKKPGYYHLIIAVVKLLVRLVEKTVTKVFFLEQWVLFISSPPKNFPAVDLKNFHPIIPPRDRFWADPFVISKDNKHYLFIEELPYKTKKGHLTCMILDESGKIETSQIILEKPYHLSYPFIFNHDRRWFLIPESAENKTVDLYECVEFPFKWEFRRTLLEGFRAYDSTLHFSDDRIWLFCTIQQSEGGSPNDNLHLFSSSNLLQGTWTPHPMNPVVSDPYNARPAGKIVNHEGVLYRPSQVCVPRYGYALAMNRIDELNENSYHETRVIQILPNSHNHMLSTHTYNTSGQLTIIDGQIKRFRY